MAASRTISSFGSRNWGRQSKMNLDRFNQRRQFSQEFVDGVWGKPVCQALLRPF